MFIIIIIIIIIIIAIIIIIIIIIIYNAFNVYMCRFHTRCLYWVSR